MEWTILHDGQLNERAKNMFLCSSVCCLKVWDTTFFPMLQAPQKSVNFIHNWECLCHFLHLKWLFQNLGAAQNFTLAASLVASLIFILSFLWKIFPSGWTRHWSLSPLYSCWIYLRDKQSICKTPLFIFKKKIQLAWWQNLLCSKWHRSEQNHWR